MTALAEDNLPARLVFGYDDEGKIDASPAACRDFVAETVEWDTAATARAIRDVCKARQRHVDGYATIQKSYAALAKILREETRLDGASAIAGFRAMVKGCIDFKFSMTTGGHNIGMDIIPNDIAASCLDAGTKLLDAEIASRNDNR